MIRATVAMLGVSAVLSLTARAGEIDDEPVVELLRRGIAAFGEADFERSRQLLEQASARADRPQHRARIQLYLGMNDAVTGAPAKARLRFATALREDPTLVPDARQFKKELLELFASVRAGLRGTLQLRGEPGAAVTVDGEERGRLPLSLELPIGRHQIEAVSRDGRSELRQAVDIRPEQIVELVLQLRARPAPAGRPSTPEAAAPGPSHPSQVEPQVQTRLWTWVTMAGAGAALAAALAVGYAADRDYYGWQAGCRAEDCGTLRTSVEHKDVAANVLFGVAAALAVTSVVLYFVEGRPARGERAKTVRAVLGRGICGAGLVKRF